MKAQGERRTAGAHGLARACALVACAALAGCMSAPPRADTSYAPTMPEPAVAAAAPADGAIWHDAQNMELFSDPKAHRAGDILTIVLVENTQASKKASTTTSKKDKTDLAAPTILGSVASLHGKAASIGLDGERAFDGSGSSSQSNQLSGEITVTVAQRLANGNLLVRGEKWLTINQGQELVRIAGIVRPQDIGPDNTVPSTRVADARIAYTGKGTLADANSKGWLSRFFSSKWMPF
ncbi:MAG: flagellar basal body L-ring protein FlgH [Xanthomonadaceae bacterium]|nr:flagellar basal body L-ring protein FlgH [Xanthomonadaceae bacterium]